MKRQHLVTALTFGATLLAGGIASAAETAVDAAPVASSTESKTQQASKPQVATQAPAKEASQSVAATSDQPVPEKQAQDPVKEVKPQTEGKKPATQQPVANTQQVTTSEVKTQPSVTVKEAECEATQPEKATQASESTPKRVPGEGNTKPSMDDEGDLTGAEDEVVDEPSVDEKNQAIQDQIDHEKEHMEQDKTQVGHLEDENKDLQDQIDSNSDKKDQEISAVDETAKEEIQNSQNELDKIEQDQIQSEKDEIQSEINKTEDQLEDTKDEIADKEGIVQEKQDELDKLEDQNQANSVMGSLVNNDKIGSHDAIYVGERIPGTDLTEKTEEYYDQSKATGQWYLDNKNKEEIKNKELSQEQAWELNLYLMERINAARRAAGQKEFIVTKDMFDKVYQRAEAAKTDFNHDMNDIRPVFGSNWAGENLGFAGSYQDYARLINNALSTINIMMNADGGEDHWGHRDNFLRDYYKDWGDVEAAFAFVWSDKYNRWVMVFDVMKYDGGTDHAHDLDNKYTGNPNQDRINQLKQDIANLEQQIEALKDQSSSLQNKITDLEHQKDNVKFDYNKLDDSEKLDYIAHSQNIEQTKEWQQEKTQEIEDKYTEINDNLYQQIDDNQKQINQLKDEIQAHQDKIAELEGQLEEQPSEPEEKPEEPSKPEEKPEEPSKPEEKPEQPSEPEEKPEEPSKPEEKPEQPSEPEEKPEEPSKPEEKPEQPSEPEEKPEEPSKPEEKPEQPSEPEEKPEEDNSVPMTPLEPSTPVEDNNVPMTPLQPSTPIEQPNNGWNPNFKDPADIIGGTQSGSHVSNNGTQYEPVQLPTGNTTVYLPTQHTDNRTMTPSTSDYHFVGQAEAAEINAPVEAATRMERLHGELPQTGNEENQALATAGIALTTLGSIFGLATLRRRKEQ